MLALDSSTSPVNNYLPHTSKPGDRGASWGSNRIQQVVNQQINIFTPGSNRNYLNMGQDNAPVLSAAQTQSIKGINQSNSTNSLLRYGAQSTQLLLQSPDML